MHCETYCIINNLFWGQIQSNFLKYTSYSATQFSPLAPTTWVYSSKTSKALCHGSAMAGWLRGMWRLATDAEKPNLDTKIHYLFNIDIHGWSDGCIYIYMILYINWHYKTIQNLDSNDWLMWLSHPKMFIVVMIIPVMTPDETRWC